MKHKVRGVEIEVLRADAREMNADMVATEMPLAGDTGQSLR